MKLEIQEYTKNKIPDVLDFERRLRKEENFWGWEIDEAYIRAVERSFDDRAFDDSISLLAYVDGLVVGRIDASCIASRFDGSKKAYLCCKKQQTSRGRAKAAGDLERNFKRPTH